jgi:carbonic anhydrase
VGKQTTGTFRPSTDDLVANNESFAQAFADHGLSLGPKRHLAVVACMDSRMDIFEMLGLAHGDAHIIRNAGGVITNDVIRSLVVSQRLLDTREIILIHHTNCGLEGLVEGALLDEIVEDCGIKPWWSLESFKDPYSDVRQSIGRILHSPFIKYKDHVRGFVYDVETGRLTEVDPDPRHFSDAARH